MWGHVTGTTISPSHARVPTRAIAAVAVPPRVDVVSGAVAVTQTMADLDIRKLEDFEITTPRSCKGWANFVVVTMEAKDVTATVVL